MNLLLSVKIDEYVEDGFKQVVSISQESWTHRWVFENVDSDCFIPHTSWVYMICVSGYVVKIGETNLPLLISKTNESFNNSNSYVIGKGRFGRMVGGDGTDAVIRRELHSRVSDGQVSIFALKCPIKKTTVMIGGTKQLVFSKTNQELEKLYIDDFVRKSGGYLPSLNLSRK